MATLKVVPEKFAKRAWGHIRRADYGKALKAAEQCLKAWPHDFEAERLYAAVLGDYADVCKPENHQRLKRESVRRLRALTRRLRGKRPSVAGMVRNEYYFQSRNYASQYALGVEEVERGSKAGYYCQGVGAAWRAKQLLMDHRMTLARFWAERSKRAWSKYLRFEPRYYNSYIHYALAVGILGAQGEAERLLETAARLSRKSKSFREFDEIRVFLRRYASVIRQASPGHNQASLAG